MSATSTPESPLLKIERLTLEGSDPSAPAALAPGLQRGEVFIARGLLQAADALEPIRTVILDSLEEVCGLPTRRAVEALGLRRLHRMVSVEALTRIHPLVTGRVRRLSPGIVQAIAEAMQLGPDVHFEDAPNVRLFLPHDVTVRHGGELATFASSRGAGRLTLHGPHQDDRHFHPLGAVNIWCALDRVQEGNGMAVYPEFYGHLVPYTASDASIRGDQYLGPPIAPSLELGDALCFEALHLHGSTINQTAETRAVVSFRLTLEPPRHREKQWYSYVRPADCDEAGPPPVRIDYSLPPGRGPTTLDTSDRMPSMADSTVGPDGLLELRSETVQEGRIRPVSTSICLARIRGEVVSFARRCPHAHADLAGATIRDDQVICPWHGLRLSLVDGSSGCASILPLARATCEESGGVIRVKPPRLAHSETSLAENARALD